MGGDHEWNLGGGTNYKSSFRNEPEYKVLSILDFQMIVRTYN